MKPIVRKLFLATVLSLISSITFAQITVTGKIISEDYKNPVPAANIYLESNPTKGTISNELGEFSFQITNKNDKIVISAIGFETMVLDLTTKMAEIAAFGQILLKPQPIDLSEITIISSLATDRKTPVSVSTISSKTIEKELGDQPYPSILKKVPGVYATRTGGGSGDAMISLRGFKQENVALMLNGIPISSVENGLVYWNNWIGLAEATQMIQVQKGLGASKVALNSVGGTINIITKSTEAQKGGSFQHSITSYGNQKSTLRLSTGLLDNGWALTFLGSRTKGPGYVDATYVDGWAYFISASKQFGKNHKLVLTVLGAPEKHGQRNLLLNQREVNLNGIKFNKDWGSYNGQLNNSSENFYHKPQISANHYWNISDKTFLATSAYFSFGKGGGKWSESFNWGPGIYQFRNASGQLDWQGIYTYNQNNQTPVTLANGSDTTGYAKIIQTDFLASHVWAGVLSTLEHKINDQFKLIAGIHGRYFKSRLYEEVRDLLGADFWIENYGWSFIGVAGRDQIKTVGDLININNGAIVNYGNLFTQLEYENGNLNAFAAGSISNTWYQRYDHFNYLENPKSDMVTKFAYDFKAGSNLNVTEKSNIYLNAGYYSKAPYYKFVFSNYTNVPSKDISNEKVLSAEIGYGFKSQDTRVKLNAYYTNWKDIAFLSKEYIQLENNDQTRALVKGLDALHTGIELEFQQKLANNINIGLMASLGNWKWKNDVNAELFNDQNQIVDTVLVYANGLYVGDAPQTQLGLFANFKLLKSIDVSIDWLFNDRLYADFDPTNRNNDQDRSQSFQLPSYHMVDIHLGYNFNLFNNQAFTGFSCYNVLNSEYILRGQDGPTHTIDSFQGYWGFGRTFNLVLRLII